MSFERANIQAMRGYVSGEQPDNPAVIKLNTNENPYPPGPAVEKALATVSVADLRRYPPPTATGLRQTIADLHDLTPDNVVVTNGGDELLRLALSTFVESSENIGVAEPSYSLYEVLANAHGCGYARFELTPDWRLPEDFAEQLNQANIKLALVVNPHAPSGTLLPVDEIRQLAQAFKGVLVLDEAYVDFVDPALGYDSTGLLAECDNLLILRTFSKGYSLAGLRMAYGLGPASLIEPMQYKTKDSYNTDYIAQQLAIAAIEDQDYARSTWAKVREERGRVLNALTTLGFDCPPSQSNFLLATVPAGRSATEIYQALKEKDILVRYFSLPRLEDKLRITIGTPEENARLLTALKGITS